MHSFIRNHLNLVQFAPLIFFVSIGALLSGYTMGAKKRGGLVSDYVLFRPDGICALRHFFLGIPTSTTGSAADECRFLKTSKGLSIALTESPSLVTIG